jgi:pentapeptide repeat protein
LIMPMLALSVGVAAFVAFVIVAYLRRWSWTGFVSPPPDGDSAWGSPGASKTLWDWLQLFIVPLVLAVGAFWLNDEQRQRDKKQEMVRAKHEDQIAEDGRREGALRDYLQRMSQFVLGPARDDKDARARAVALTRTFTITVLTQLDSRRKGIVVQFLSETGLIRRSPRGPDVLDGADLQGASLKHMVLDRVNFSGANLRDADLDGALMTRTMFRFARLRGATLREAFIDGTDFGAADLRDADFTKAAPADEKSGVFAAACVSGTHFDGANLIGANFTGAEGWKVDFTGAELDGAHLEGARLGAVTLDGATTSNTHFPAGWRRDGIELSRDERDDLCKNLEWWRRG